MSWSVELSKDADKFIKKNPQTENHVINEIKQLVRKINGETVSINMKKLSGHWEGYCRIRKGKIRIIVELDSANKIVYVESIDFRGNVYK